MFDDACMLWQDNCGQRGSCLYYDNKKIGLHVFLLTMGFKVLSLVLVGGAWFFYKPPPPSPKEAGTFSPPNSNEQDGGIRDLEMANRNTDAGDTLNLTGSSGRVSEPMREQHPNGSVTRSGESDGSTLAFENPTFGVNDVDSSSTHL